jgi:hypothetical protein
MNRTPAQQQLRENYVIALVQATLPLQQAATDPELTLELLIEAADLLKERLEAERSELHQEQD